jgi:hypothetical protein
LYRVRCSFIRRLSDATTSFVLPNHGSRKRTNYTEILTIIDVVTAYTVYGGARQEYFGNKGGAHNPGPNSEGPLGSWGTYPSMLPALGWSVFRSSVGISPYELGLTHLMDEVERIVSEFINRPVFWFPRFMMGDGAAAITNGFGTFSTDRPPVRLTSFFHVQQLIHEHQNEFGLERAEKIVLKSQIDNLQCARSLEPFRQGIRCLREYWRSRRKGTLRTRFRLFMPDRFA